jgi:hypothetical protein
VRTAAPWLRGFPTVATWDDAAGRALVRADLFQPARDFTRIARTQRTISERDAAEMELLAEAADVGDYQGQKAGNRTVGSAKNLLIAAAGTIAQSLSGDVASDFGSQSRLVQRAGATLSEAEAQVEAFAATLPDDLSQALRALVQEGRRLGESAPRKMPSGDEAQAEAFSAPFPLVSAHAHDIHDIESQARAMILEGRAPPIGWRPLIRSLDFFATTLGSLEPLAGLIALQRLNLSRTRVSDLSPLTGLTALEHLILRRTQVSDLSPVAELTALQHLDLTVGRDKEVGTEIRHLSPLAGLTALQHLDLF